MTSPAADGEAATARATAKVAQPRRRVALIDRHVPLYRHALYRELVARPDIEFRIIAAATPIEYMPAVEYPSDLPWQDAPTRRLPLIGGVWQWGAVKAGFARRYDTLVMQANPHDLSLWAAVIGAKLTGKRVLMWTHGYTRIDRGLKLAVRKAWYRLADALLLYGHLGKVLSMKFGVPAERCHVIYNSLDHDEQVARRAALDPARVAAVRTELGITADTPLAVSISRLTAAKRIDMLLAAVAQLRRQDRGLHLLIVGDGPERATIEAKIAELELGDNVTMYGACFDETALAELLSAADVSVIPGAIGLSVMHSLAYGVPVITHDDPYAHGPEFEAVVPGRTGDVFKQGDVADLARVLEAWLHPTPRKAAVTGGCHQHVARFYTPAIQADAMCRAILGEAPDDLHVAYQSSPEPKSK